MSALWTKSGIVVACDVRTLQDLEVLIRSTSQVHAVVAYKLGFSLVLRYGLGNVVERVREQSDKPLIYDHQKAGTDIPEMGSPFAEACAECRVDAAILFPHAGPATLEAWVTSLEEFGLIPIVGAVMTHPRFLVSEGGFVADDAARRIYKIALRQGVTHFVLPATKPDHVNALMEEARVSGIKNLVAMSPGIGRQGAEIKVVRDWFKGLIWLPIVGSTIYKSKDPAGQATSLGQELGLPAEEGLSS